MAGLLRPGATLQVPKRLPIGGSLRIDWSHPLTRGLIGCFVPGITGGINLTGQCAPLAIKTAADTRKSTVEGPSWTTTADSAGLFGASCPAAFKTWTQFSIYWRGNFTSYSTNNTKVFGIEFDNIGSTPFAVASLGYGGSTGTNFVAEWNTNGTYTHDVGVALTAGYQGLCGTFKVGGNVVLYRNGLVIDTTAFGATAPTSAGSSLINFQTSNGNGGNFSGSGNVGYMWNRELSAGEVLLLDSDPYAFLIAGEGEMSALFVDAFADVADNPTEPFTLRPPSLSPALPYAIRIDNPTPAQNIAFWTEPQGIQKQTPPVDTNQPDWYNETFLEPSTWWWDQAQSLLKHQTTVDTNLFTVPFGGQSPFATETRMWWSQPPDLFHRGPPLDTNQSRLVSQQFATPSTLAFWVEAVDLERRPQQHDPNQSRLSYQDQSTPTAFGFWVEPIDLERHPTQTDPNQSRVSFQDQATPTLFGFWAEPPDLLRHPTALDTNQGLDLWFDPLSVGPALTPSTWWWLQQTALQWHPPQLDTNESRLVSQQFAEPAVWWWTSPTDLQRHPTHLDTNQSRIVNPVGWTPTSYFLAPQISVQRRTPEVFPSQPFVFFPPPSGATPLEFGFWTQSLDLLRHPSHLDTNQQRLVYPVGWTPDSLGFWIAQVDLYTRARHLDTNQSFVFLPPPPGATPNILGFWAQPPDLSRHATHLDTNVPRVSYQDRATPSTLGFWSESPDLQRHPSTVDTNEPRLVSQQFAEPAVWWWTQPQMQPPRPADLWAGQPYLPQGWQLSSIGLLANAPQFMPPRTPDLWSSVPYVGQGWQLSQVGLWVPKFTFMPPSPPRLTAAAQFCPKFTIPPNQTPDTALFFGQPQDLLRMPPAASVLPWTYVPGSFRFQFGFFGSAFIASRNRLSQPSTKPRYNISARGVSSLTSTNRIMQGFRKMSRAPDLFPPIVAGVEQEYVQFDFAPGLNPGIIISAIVAVNVYSLTGNDPTPMVRLLNTPALVASPSTLLANQGIVALFGNMIAGLYLLQAIIQTSDGQVLSTEARWPCVAATP